MPFFNIEPLRRAKRSLSADWRSGGVVLLYHRVADLVSDPQRLAVSPQHFDRHLEIVTRDAALLPLDELIDRAGAGTLPARAVAVTFDDGYADTLHAAAPALSRHRVPATTFVATGGVDARDEFWWDALERLVLAGPIVTVDLAIDDARRRYDTGPELYTALLARMRRMTSAERRPILADLQSQIDAPAARVEDLPLSPAEVRSLAAIDGMTIGSHSVSHLSLGAVDRDCQRAEIGGARAQLEAWTGAPVDTFAYPFGGADDVSGEVVDELRESGVRIACTTVPGRVHRDTDPLRVPRLIVRNWDAETFSARLAEWTS